MKAFFRELLVIIILVAVISFLFRVVLQTTVIRYASMEPALQEEQRIFVNKIVYSFHEPDRGDVIIFDPPFESEEPFIKRVIGLPGESIEIKQGTVYIHKNGNAFLLDEPYVKEPIANTFKGDLIPENEYFVMGDNRNNSSDSRTGWTAKREDIIGKAWLSIWPPDSWGLITNPLQN